MSYFNDSDLHSLQRRCMNEFLTHCFPENAKILIVEDEQIIAWDVESLLRDHGVLRILVASSLQQAREHLAQHNDINLALLDLKLGDGSGLELISSLQQRNIPIVITTGYPVPDAGKIPVLYKPCSPGHLIAMALEAIQDSSLPA